MVEMLGRAPRRRAPVEVVCLAGASIALALAGCAAEVAQHDVETADDTTAESLLPNTTPPPGARVECDVLVVGASTGGVASALAAARVDSGLVCLTEETDWVGGQLTAQGLNASDDNRYTDSYGATRSYQRLRTQMRARYGGASNPGGCWVSHLCAEPKVALEVLERTLLAEIQAGKLRMFYGVRPTGVEKSGARVRAVQFERIGGGGAFTLAATQTIDATELGDLLPLAGAAYRVGQEARADTNEADAPVHACRDCVQSFTYDVVLERRPSNERHVIPRPAGYGEKPWMRGFTHNGFPMFGRTSVWSYRRIVEGERFGRTDLSIMNWGDGNDYWWGNVLDRPLSERALHFERARERALAYVYWLQTEADGHGYPFLKLRSDVLGTTNGVAKFPYIRESRRIVALETIRVEDITDYYNRGARARTWGSTGGIGLYPIDMHKNVSSGSGWPRGHALPFQIPLGALVPRDVDGLLAGAKNYGTTHLTNSAYRLHPIEWAAGEAAGTFAAMSVSWEIEPRQVLANEAKTRELQRRLLADGAPLYWMDDVAMGDDAWRDIQFVAAIGVMGGPELDSLHFLPDATFNRAQAADALVRALGWSTTPPSTARFSDVPTTFWAAGAIETLAQRGIVLGTGDGRFSPANAVTREQLRAMIARARGIALGDRAVARTSADARPISRRDAARALAATVVDRLYLPN